MRYGMMIELDKCIGCQACVTACKERWDSGPGAARDWVMEFEHGRRGEDLGITFYPGLCNHCDEHPCTTDCPTGATFMNDDGVVEVDPEVCIGCGNCISMCPYGARHADAKKGFVEKCNFCAPYVRRGETPACVQSCLGECRHFGDLDDQSGTLRELIAEHDAQPLFNAETRIGPNVYYAPPQDRAHLLEAGVIRSIERTRLSQLWQDATGPAARYGVPAIAVATAAGGLFANLIARREQLRKQPETKGPVASPKQEHHDAEQVSAAVAALPAKLPRHRLGMRLLHWFNVLSWLALLITGTALMIAPSFALFGTAFPETISRLVGGQANLIKLHVLWGLAWAVVIVPLFLYHKRGGLDALREIRFTRDDLRWMMKKPLVMIGRLSPSALPPQDKYNAGQKGFAATALIGTSLIIVTGVIMTFHLGSPELIRWAILGHKLAILLALVGLAVHITMAAIIKDERPALRSMVVGEVDRGHAAHHSSKWVERLAQRRQPQTAADTEDGT